MLRALADNACSRFDRFMRRGLRRVLLQRGGLDGVDLAEFEEFDAPAADSLPIVASEIYKSFFHGPAYQVIDRARVSDHECVALMAHNLGPNTEPAAVLARCGRLV